MTEIASGNYKQAVDSGIQKIKQLDLEAVSKVQQLKDAFADKRYKQVTLLYDALNKNIQDKKDQIQNIYSATNDLYKSVQDKTKADLAAAKLNQTVDLNTIEQLSPMLVNSLNGDAAHDDPIYASYAKNYGLDENLLRGGVATLTNKTKEKTAVDDQNYIQSLLKGGYQTINPADVARMRASGNNVIEYKGRAYMIPQKLTSKTYKGVTTWYDAKGNVVKTSTAPNSSSSNNSSPTQKTTKFTASELKKLEANGLKDAPRADQLAFLYPQKEKPQDKAVADAQAKLASGKKWAGVYNEVAKKYPQLAVPLSDAEKAQYPGNETVLDVYLGKQTYY